MSNTPTTIWKTLCERAAFGFDVQIGIEPSEYCNIDYLTKLIDQEKIVTQKFSQLLKYFILINIVGLVYTKGIVLDITIFGNPIPHIPASGQVLCFLIGSNLFALSIACLNTITISRIIDMIVRRMKVTDLPNMTISHLRGDNVWVDALVPRYSGYRSGKTHEVVSIITILIMFCFLIAIFIAGAAGLISTFQFGLTGGLKFFEWSMIVSIIGMVMGFTGIFLFIFCLFIPLPFKFDLEDLKKI